MKDIYSWVNSAEDLRARIAPLEDRSSMAQPLENTLALIVNVECAIFIHDFTGHGFAGK
jgi:hypothetical protein